jgi:hypothetical protein
VEGLPSTNLWAPYHDRIAATPEEPVLLGFVGKGRVVLLNYINILSILSRLILYVGSASFVDEGRVAG